MREFFSVIFLTFVLVNSMALSAVGGCFTAAGNLLHIYWQRLVARNDARYAHAELEDEDEPDTVHDLVNARGSKGIQ